MDVLHILNKQKRKNKNLFGVFYKQKTFYDNRIKIDAKENKSKKSRFRYKCKISK